VDNDDGVVLDHTVERGNPADAPQLAPAIGRVIRRTRRAFRRTVNWRTGSEAQISTLKRQYGWDRKPPRRPRRSPDLDGHGVLGHYLVKIAALAG
jgi:IS5 family transposase